MVKYGLQRWRESYSGRCIDGIHAAMRNAKAAESFFSLINRPTRAACVRMSNQHRHGQRNHDPLANPASSAPDGQGVAGAVLAQPLKRDRCSALAGKPSPCADGIRSLSRLRDEARPAPIRLLATGRLRGCATAKPVPPQDVLYHHPRPRRQPKGALRKGCIACHSARLMVAATEFHGSCCRHPLAGRPRAHYRHD
jgi:hypothetical protein